LRAKKRGGGETNFLKGPFPQRKKRGSVGFDVYLEMAEEPQKGRPTVLSAKMKRRKMRKRENTDGGKITNPRGSVTGEKKPRVGNS